MIVEPTVLVLGAGASQPYGFPVGSELAERVCAGMPNPKLRANDTHLSKAISEAFSSRDDITLALMTEFSAAYRDSGCTSLDEFVEARGNRKFLSLVKAAIVCLIGGHEKDDALYPDSTAHLPAGTPHRDWIRYLFRHMRTDDPATFASNKVVVLTFNFDRSFERKLFRLIKSSYGVSDAVAAELRRHIPVLHLHGSLGEEGWCPGQPCTRDRHYCPEISVPEKRRAFDDIRIVHEEVSEELLEKADHFLHAAHTVCFLGFGFHPTNMGRLGIGDEHPETLRWIGTALGMSTPETDRALKSFGPDRGRVELHNCTAHELLRAYPVLVTERD